MPARRGVRHTGGCVRLAWVKWHLHHGIHRGLDQLRSAGGHGWAPGHHTSRSRHRLHPRHDGSHIILLLFDSVLFYQLGVLLLLFTDLKLSAGNVHKTGALGMSEPSYLQSLQSEKKGGRR